MDIIEPSKPQNLSIFVPNAKVGTPLNDFRVLQKFGGINFGSLEQVSKNLGIKMEIVESGLIFSAPRVRLQMFVEKLHFSMIGYKML